MSTATQRTGLQGDGGARRNSGTHGTPPARSPHIAPVTSLRPTASAASVGAAIGRAAVATRPRLRLTRRGRIVFTGLAATPLVIAAALLGVNGGDAVAGSSTAPVSFETVTIAPGESLWAVAERVAPNADPRDVVHEILTLNGLTSAQLQPGQQLALPNAFRG